MKNLRPRTVGEVRILMGLLDVYRRHIKNFAQIADPFIIFSALTYGKSSQSLRASTKNRSKIVGMETLKSHEKLLGIEIVCVRPSKGLDPTYDIIRQVTSEKRNACA